MPMKQSWGRSVAPKAAAAVLVGIVLATGCSSGGSEGESNTASTSPPPSDDALVDEGTPVEGGNLTIAVAAETDGWNPATNQWAQEGNTIGSTFIEPLMTFNGEGEPVPWLAESLTPSNPEASSWTIKLREGISFQDGSPMDADAVVESLRFQATPGSLSSVVTGNLIGEPTVTGPYTIEMSLKIDWGAFPSLLAGAYGLVMAPSMLAESDNGSSAPVGTGAFEFERAERDRFVRVTRFDDYWGGPCAIADPSEDVKELCASVDVPLGQPNGPFLDAIEFRPIPDNLQRVNALEAGDVDLIYTRTPADTAALREDYQVVTDYGTEQTQIVLVTGGAPFDDIHARRAIALATDREALVSTFGAGEDLGMSTAPFNQDSFWGAGMTPEDSEYPLFDPEKAREEVELYKQATGSDTLRFALTGTATTDDLAVMQALAEQWASVGIEADLNTVKQEQMVGAMVGGESQAVLTRNYGFPDPDTNFFFWSRDFADGPIFINFSRWWNEKTQAGLDLGRKSQDREFRQDAYTEVFKERNRNVLDIWLFDTPWAMVGERDIRGLNWFRVIPFANYLTRPYISSLWVDPNVDPNG